MLYDASCDCSHMSLHYLRNKKKLFFSSLFLCYDLKSLEWDQRTTLVLSNIRELDRVPKTKYSTLYTITHGPC